jgi:mono/diheme cytochrome c family protein
VQVGWRSWAAGGTALGLAILLLADWRTVGGSRARAASAADRDVPAGRALFATHCATCHGDGGRGDGASAAAFATKPSDLADGRLMNGLPDEFLISVITHGGPAQGLAPTMPPFDRTLSADQIRRLVTFVRTLARPEYRGGPKMLARPPRAPRQPIFFNHAIHAGSFQIPCQYCHADARRSEYAGLPSVERCVGCHKIIGVADNPEIGKIHDYARRGAPVPWTRVFKVPEFTYFPHKAHVRADVACQTCHGPIERMPVVGADTGPALTNDLAHLVGLRPPQRPLTMGWCIDCHRRENTTRATRAPLDCVSCHH